jgi:hypothetical protein
VVLRLLSGFRGLAEAYEGASEVTGGDSHRRSMDRIRWGSGRFQARLFGVLAGGRYPIGVAEDSPIRRAEWRKSLGAESAACPRLLGFPICRAAEGGKSSTPPGLGRRQLVNHGGFSCRGCWLTLAAGCRVWMLLIRYIPTVQHVKRGVREVCCIRLTGFEGEFDF